MKKSYWKIGLTLIMLLAMTGCKHDDFVSPESVDSKYDIKFYSQSPHSQGTQGIFVAGRFIRLSSNNVPPFRFMVYVKNKKGQEALDYLQSKNDSPILKMEEMAGESKQKRYIIESTKYFETRNLYVSEYYKTEDIERDDYFMAFLPQIIVKMKDGYDISIIEEYYRNAMTMNEDEKMAAGVYLFDCNVNSSYNILKLAEEIYNREEVEYTDPISLGKYIN
jgi:hypothetical protein